MIWNNSRMQVLYFNETEADESWPCVVRISETEIVVEYQDESTVIYKGANDGTGHFTLACDDGSKATLHMFPGSDTLEGSWRENGDRGMWRIKLES